MIFRDFVDSTIISESITNFRIETDCDHRNGLTEWDVMVARVDDSARFP